MKSNRKRKRKLKQLAATWLTFLLYAAAVIIAGNTTYQISPLPFDDFQLWRASRMEYLFAGFLLLFLATLVLPLWAMRKRKLKIAALLSVLGAIIPFFWLVAVFSLNLS